MAQTVLQHCFATVAPRGGAQKREARYCHSNTPKKLSNCHVTGKIALRLTKLNCSR